MCHTWPVSSFWVLGVGILVHFAGPPLLTVRVQLSLAPFQSSTWPRGLGTGVPSWVSCPWSGPSLPEGSLPRYSRAGVSLLFIDPCRSLGMPSMVLWCAMEPYAVYPKCVVVFSRLTPSFTRSLGYACRRNLTFV